MAIRFVYSTCNAILNTGGRTTILLAPFFLKHRHFLTTSSSSFTNKNISGAVNYIISVLKRSACFTIRNGLSRQLYVRNAIYPSSFTFHSVNVRVRKLFCIIEKFVPGASKVFPVVLGCPVIISLGTPFSQFLSRRVSCEENVGLDELRTTSLNVNKGTCVVALNI